MKCSNCGAEVGKGRFCNFCGSELPKDDDFLERMLGYVDGQYVFDRGYIVDTLRGAVESACSMIKSGCNYAKKDDDYDELTRAEFCFFVLFLIMDGDYFDEENLEVIEAATSYRINRDKWDAYIKVGRLRSDKEYLSQPPETIKFMLEIDNALYDRGYVSESASMLFDIIYRNVGKVFVNINKQVDVKRLAKLNCFEHMVEKYLLNNARYQNYRTRLENGQEWTGEIRPL